MEKAHSVSSWRGPLGDRGQHRREGLVPKEMALGRPIRQIVSLLLVFHNISILQKVQI